MKSNKFSINAGILSMLLVLLMVLGTIIPMASLTSFADGEEGGDTTGTGDSTEVVDPDEEDEDAIVNPTIEEAIEAYLTKEYESAEEKVAKMTEKLTKGDYIFYCDEYTGEIAIKNTVTGQILTSNPYDVATNQTESVKQRLLSQVVVSYKDLANNGQTAELFSYRDAAMYGQVSVKNIKNGVRVEYTLGRAQSKKLMPYWIEASRFEKMILSNITSNYDMATTLSYYQRKDVNDETLPKKTITEYQQVYACVKSSYSKLGATPMYDRTETDSDGETVYITEYTDHNGTVHENRYKMSDKLVIYAVNAEVTQSERMSNTMESYTKMYAPDYSYEERDYDIELTGYVGDESGNATFRLAIEYTLTDTGLTLSLPANSIRYDADKYRLNNISVLPYMGTTSLDVPGYTFIPDGSGAIIRNEDIKADARTYTVSGKVYGPDFAYHSISYNGKSEIVRMPVFGVIDALAIPEEVGREVDPPLDSSGAPAINPVTGEYMTQSWVAKEEEVMEIKDEYGDTVKFVLKEDPTVECEQSKTSSGYIYYRLNEDGTRAIKTKPIYEYTYIPQGFFAVIEEGESLCEIVSDHGGNITHKYNSAYASFLPESSDSYNLSESISVGADAEWTVVSERKYTGQLKINYYMLSSVEGSKYDATYMGMAKVYRDYLDANGVLSVIDDAAADIPLYIESFGMIKTEDTVLTIPVMVDTPLTTFGDVQTMYKKLSESGVSNVNFKLTGFNKNGTSYQYSPSLVKFEKVLGGNDGYSELVKDANDNGYGVFPEFDFANVNSTAFFDGFSLRKQTIRTIDDRYANKREYDAIYQSFSTMGTVTVSPCAYSDIFAKFSEKMDALGVSGISASTLGSDLNTDFDEDEPYNREDDKEFTSDLLASLNESYKNIMVSGGNAYTWKYVSHILNVSLDSSRYLRASQSIPFIGLVLHGSINFAGDPTNMEGNLKYEILKIIENGASPYYTLSYQNTQELKTYGSLTKYYSVDFSIWFDDLVETYNTINEALRDVQTSRIDDHQFVEGERTFTEEERPDYERELEAVRAEYLEMYNGDLMKAIKDAYRDGYIELPDGYDYATDEEGKIIAPEGFDLEEFEEDYITFEDYNTKTRKTKIDDYSIVYEHYENGISFIINYNEFPVAVELDGKTYDVGAYAFVKIDASGNVVAKN